MVVVFAVQCRPIEARHFQANGLLDLLSALFFTASQRFADRISICSGHLVDGFIQILDPLLECFVDFLGVVLGFMEWLLPQSTLIHGYRRVGCTTCHIVHSKVGVQILPLTQRLQDPSQTAGFHHPNFRFQRLQLAKCLDIAGILLGHILPGEPAFINVVAAARQVSGILGQTVQHGLQIVPARSPLRCLDLLPCLFVAQLGHIGWQFRCLGRGFGKDLGCVLLGFLDD